PRPLPSSSFSPPLPIPGRWGFGGGGERREGPRRAGVSSPTWGEAMPPLPELSTFSIWAFGVGGLAAGLLGLLAGWAAGARRSGPGLAPALLGLTALGVLSAATGRPPGLGWPTLALAGLLLLFRAARSDRL